MFNMWNCLHWGSGANNWITDQRTLNNGKADGLQTFGIPQEIKVTYNKVGDFTR